MKEFFIGAAAIFGVVVAFLTGMGLLTALTFLYSTFSYGVVMWAAWDWFVAPTFALSALTFAQSIGLMAFIFACIHPHRIPVTNKLTEDEKPKTTLVAGFLVPWMSLFLCWVIHLVVI
jgi:hypothetical protein